MSTQNQNTQSAAGLYIPVHRRAASRGDAASATGTNPSSPAISMRSLSPTEGRESKSGSGSPLLQLPIYTMQELLMLSNSPFVSFSQEQREKLRETIPEILMNRKQRKFRAAREYQQRHNNQNLHTNPNQHQLLRQRAPEPKPEPETRQAQEMREPLSPMWTPQTPPRRTRFGRAERRRNARTIVEELSWRVPRTRTISGDGTVVSFPVA